MSEVWINYPELEDCIGHDAAERLCRMYGGVALYVPRKADAPHPRVPFLGQLVGTYALKALCREYGGLRIVVPNIRGQVPLKGEIIQRLEAGEKPVGIALALGVTERYVRRVAQNVGLTQKSKDNRNRES